MKKFLLSLITVLVVLTSCEKEDDLLVPVNPPNTNTTVNNTDTTTVGNTDTTTNNNGGVTVLPPSQTFPLSFATALGEGYDVTTAEFEINCSEQTNHLADTSYSYVSTNYLSPVTAEKQYGNGFISFYETYMSPSFDGGPGVLGRFATTTYPMNSNYWPAHALDFEEQMMLNWILSYSYTPGTLTLDLATYACGGDVVYWTVDLVVTEYSDGTIELSIDNGPNTTMDGQITWNSDLKLTLQKNW
tara:strand:+ start:2473 stop:3204 length:732 start_codon:yes stop_codon:yes gene_type:complete